MAGSSGNGPKTRPARAHEQGDAVTIAPLGRTSHAGLRGWMTAGQSTASSISCARAPAPPGPAKTPEGVGAPPQKG